jgi:hypothetical protein
MKRFLFFALLFCGINSTAQVITASIGNRSRYLLHTIKWTSREKNGFQDGNNIIQKPVISFRLAIQFASMEQDMR